MRRIATLLANAAAITLATALFVLSPLLPIISVSAESSLPQTTIEQRVQYYKSTMGAALPVAEQKRLALRCGVAQAAVKNLQPNVAKVQTARTTAYKNIVDKLNTLIKKLNDQAYETTKLQGMIDTLNGKIKTYDTHIDGYKQAVDDLATINCTGDPVAFKAALVAARTAHDSLPTDVSDIRVYITNTIKPQLSQIQQDLKAGHTAGGN